MSIVAPGQTTPVPQVKINVALSRALKAGESIALLRNGAVSNLVPALINPRLYVYTDDLQGTGTMSYRVRFTSPSPPPYESPAYQIYFDNPVLCAVKVFAEPVTATEPPFEYPYEEDLIVALDALVGVSSSLWLSQIDGGPDLNLQSPDVVDNAGVGELKRSLHILDAGNAARTFSTPVDLPSSGFTVVLVGHPNRDYFAFGQDSSELDFALVESNGEVTGPALIVHKKAEEGPSFMNEAPVWTFQDFRGLQTQILSYDSYALGVGYFNGVPTLESTTAALGDLVGMFSKTGGAVDNDFSLGALLIYGRRLTEEEVEVVHGFSRERWFNEGDPPYLVPPTVVPPTVPVLQDFFYSDSAEYLNNSLAHPRNAADAVWVDAASGGQFVQEFLSEDPQRGTLRVTGGLFADAQIQTAGLLNQAINIRTTLALEQLEDSPTGNSNIFFGLADSPMIGQSYTGAQARINFASGMASLITTYSQIDFAFNTGVQPTSFTLEMRPDSTSLALYQDGGLLGLTNLESPCTNPGAFKFFLQVNECPAARISEVRVIQVNEE
jgi:hypothetical protein